MIILNRKNHLKKFFLYNNWDRKVTIAVDNTRYNKNELRFYGLNILINILTRKENKYRKCLL